MAEEGRNKWNTIKLEAFGFIRYNQDNLQKGRKFNSYILSDYVEKIRNFSPSFINEKNPISI